MRINALLAQTALLWALGIVPVSGQTPAPAAPPDFSKVEITTTKLTANIYALEGQGGRIGILAGPDGVLMVESQFAPLSEKISAAIRQVSDKPVRFLINTHVHPDHSGGNENFGKMGATIIGSPQLRARLAGTASPAAALPVITYGQGMTIHMNGEEVQLIPLPQAHTDGDTCVRFRTSGVLMTGDVFRSFGFPNIDRATGGTLDGILKALGTLIELAEPGTKVVPGHGPITDREGLIAHRDMILAVRGRVAKMIQEGKTLEQIVAAKPTADYDERTGNVAATADRFVGQVHAELTGSR